MPRNLPTPRRWSSMIFLLAFGCGDSVADAGEDEVAETTAVSETNGEASDNVEAGSESGTGESGTSESGTSESGTDDATADESDMAETPETTETGEAIDCTVLDVATCMGVEGCVGYMGQPYNITGDGTICLGEPEFIGCLFAEDACLPATGTLCMGDMAFHVDNLCPPPAGFESCDPPVDPVAPCMP